MTALGEKNRLGCQTIPVLSTVLALLALPDVLTIPTFRELEQLFLKMRIAGSKVNLVLVFIYQTSAPVIVTAT